MSFSPWPSWTEKKPADAILAPAEPISAKKGLLVAVGITAGRRSRVWCQAVEGDIPTALPRTLERELADVEAVELKQAPAGFGLKFALNGKTPSEFPEAPEPLDRRRPGVSIQNDHPTR